LFRTKLCTSIILNLAYTAVRFLKRSMRDMFKGVGTDSATAEEFIKMHPRCEKSKTYFLNLNKKTVGSMSVDV